MRDLIAVALITALLITPITVLGNNQSTAEKTQNIEENLYSYGHGKGYKYNAQGWIYIHIEGTPYERGYQYGYLAGEEIVDMITRWSNVIHNSPVLSGITIEHNSSLYENISKTWWNFVRSRTKKIFWDRYPEEYQQEIKGIAAGVKARNIKVHGREIDYIDVLASNEMYEFMTRFTNPMKGFHPLKTLFGNLKNLVPTGLGSKQSFIKSFLEAPPAHHCNGFIATGDATTQGQIVTAHGVRCGGWWYPYYIAQRWNIIVDIVPSQGNRLVMSSAPGYIWSDHNYYQNEEGLVFMDTTCMQGPWTNRGYPMAIRTRRTAQYADSLDEGLNMLREKNDGIWPAAYLIGDTETGEIARMDLGWHKYKVWRTYNGFYWSANNAKSTAVRAEAMGLGLKGELLGIIEKLTGVRTWYEFYTTRYLPAPRDKKLENLGEKYYGDIDIDILKNKIMRAYPVCDEASTDVKATNTQLIENNSLWAYWGNIRGMIWNTSSLKSNLAGVKDVPPAGYTLISGLPENHNVELPKSVESPIDESDAKVVWTFDFAKDFEGRNAWYATLDLSKNTLFAATPDGKIYALDSEKGDKKWETMINSFDNQTWVNAEENMVVAGWEKEVSALNSEDGKIVWRNDDVDKVCSKPVFTENNVLIGTREGELYALDIENGSVRWHVDLGEHKVYPSFDRENRNLIVGTGSNCYSIDKENGEIKWECKMKGSVISKPEIENNIVFVGTSKTHVYALDAETGEINWNKKTGWSIVSKPEMEENVVYIGSMDHHLYAFDSKDGKILWSFDGNAAIHSSPAVYGDFVFFGCDDGNMYALNKTNGGLTWSFKPNLSINDTDLYNYITTPIVSNPITDEEKVFMSANGNIYGLDAQTVEKTKISENEERVLGPGYAIFISLAVVLAALLVVAGIYFYRKRKISGE